MQFRTRIEWARAAVQETHELQKRVIGLRTCSKVAPANLARMIQLSVELHQWSRAILTDVQAAELAAENAALKAQVKRLRKRLLEEPPE
jgi:hypothetical protein